MKIVVTARSDLSGQVTTPGGMVHLLETCRNLHLLGHDVTLFVGTEGRYQEAVPFKIVNIPIPRIRFLGTFLFPILLFIYLLAWSLFNKSDVIYENCVTYSFSGLLVAKLLGKPHAMHVHGFTPDEMEMGGHGKFRVALVLFVERWNYRLSDALFCVTPVVLEKISEVYGVSPDTSYFIYNGVDADRCRPMDRQECARTLGMDPSQEYVGFIGYLYPWSGVDKLIEAAPAIVAKRPKAQFVVVGHGIWGPQLPVLAKKAGVSEHFHFVGYQPWDQIPLFCNLFDVGVTAYTAEKGVGRYRSSMKSLEYSAAGCPVVITRARGVSDIIEEAGCGIVVEPDDMDALANAIIEILQDPELRKTMGDKGRQLIEDGYTWRHVAEKMTVVFDKLVKSPSDSG